MMVQERKKIQRQEKILSLLDDLTYATRKQLQVISNLGGDRNAHRVLHDMEKDKLISSIRTEQKIYFLSNSGKNRVGSTQGDLKKSWIKHTLMRNDLYIKLGMPDTWRKEVPIKMNGETLLIPDAMFDTGNEYHFVEIDNQQAMETNYDKIYRYKELSEGLNQKFGTITVINWYTHSELRKKKLQSACENAEIQYRII